MKVYRIARWNDRFENNRTREIKDLLWVRMPTEFDDAYTELVDCENPAAVLGAWHAILMVAARCSPRGELRRGAGIPHDPATLSRLTRIPREAIRECLERAVSVGWVEVCDEGAGIPQEGAGIPPQGALRSDQIRGEEKREDQRGSPKLSDSDCLTDCPDEVAAMLGRLGVREPARSQLAACAAVTPPELRERWRRLNADMQIKNPLAAFIHETRKAHALETPPRRNGNLSPSTVLANRRLLQRREQQK